jgi:hypothetical protein
MESEVFVKTLGLRTLCLVKINNLPLLVGTSIVTTNTNWVSFFILSVFDFKDLVVTPVDELAVLILEYLEPS